MDNTEVSNTNSLNLQKSNLEERNSKIIKVATKFTQEEVEVARRTIAKDMTDAEIAFFLKLSGKFGLDPFAKEIWGYKDHKNNLIVFAGRDGFLTLAHRSERKFLGMQSSVVYSEDEFEADIPNSKINHKVKGFGDGRGKLMGAYAIVNVEGMSPTITLVEFETFKRNSPIWRTHPEQMILKVAETHALKKAFGLPGLQADTDWEVQNGVAAPIRNEDKKQKQKRKLSDVEFDQLLRQTDEFIELHKDDYDLTDAQQEVLDKRLS